ncbi:uncharacterized protein LOC101850320 [Aplysia californica]|uniref:Uncharacterized protein LOC101850320 n=1 Tax=Aplysia californica TaxID=6500 RepID=A0ABM0ZW34_APLCA|nr:uncharacterized protein LOC101850320 [Aplysia californica]
MMETVSQEMAENKTTEKEPQENNNDLVTTEEMDTAEVINDNEISTGGTDENGNENDNEDLQLGDTSNLTVGERNELFQRGMNYEQNKRPSLALQCYLGCIKGLKKKTGFVLLPQCLHNIGDIYRDQGNYESAIHFAQAEKLFYESALIETGEIQKKLEEVASSEGSEVPTDLNELNLNALRAEEYEHLAKLCLDKKQSQLALEYAGKCTKLRQQIYGDNHEKTKTSLNMFASIYAEVGKSQYTDSINLLNEDPVNETNNQSTPAANSKEARQVPEVVMSSPAGGEPVSILRQRSHQGDESPTKEPERERKQVRFHESVEESLKLKEKEEFASLTITLIVLSVCFVILASMGMWLYCSLNRGQSCQYISAQLRKWLRYIQYNFYTLTAPRVPT